MNRETSGLGSCRLLQAQRLTAAEAAAELGVARSTLANWRHQGKGPVSVRIGRAVYYFAEDLETYLQSEREKAYANQKTRTMVALPVHHPRAGVCRFNRITGHRSEPKGR